MHLIAVSTPKSPSEERLIDEMHRLRHRVFHGRLRWHVNSLDGRERDDFDRLSPTYLMALGSEENVVGCLRLLPTTGPTMLGCVFPELHSPGTFRPHERMVESSRFCVDTSCADGRATGGIHGITLAMFAGIIEWCLLSGFDEIVTATDIRVERILRRAGWPMRRLGDPTMINETQSVAGILPVDQASFERLRPSGYSSGFVAPFFRAA
jgi:acyl homoserine lactone synthase